MPGEAPAPDRVDLETRLAHIENLLSDLSDIIARQDADIERLKAQTALLLAREKDREAQGGGGIVMGDERPPHY